MSRVMFLQIINIDSTEPYTNTDFLARVDENQVL